MSLSIKHNNLKVHQSQQSTEDGGITGAEKDIYIILIFMDATSAFDHFTKPGQEFKGDKPDFAGFEKEIKTCIGSISGEFGVKYLFTDWNRNLNYKD